jgi:integration host factor subunit alpha
VNKKNLTKRDLIKKISKEIGFSYNYSKKLFNDFFEVLILNIKEGELNLKNLGSFKLINKKARVGRNPKTNEEFTITSRKSISFKVSKKILNIFNPK